MTAWSEEHELLLAKAFLVVGPMSMMVICLFVVLGMAPGLESGHPREYLVATCVLWAILIMILPLLRVLKLLALPMWMVAIITANMYFYVISLNLGLYLDVSWWGDMGHVVSSTIVAGIVFLALALMDSRSPEYVTLGNRAGFCIMLFLVALSFGGIWEVLEGSTDAIAGNPYMVYGASDTMGDLTADTVGVLAITVYAYLVLGKKSTDEITSSVKLGRKAFA
ncbi:MAG: hypothetical protein MJZ68_03490 [archaeon]|nr:hypothetical protein [archaeon]